MSDVSARLYAELWVSLASLLRSYTAAHGLNQAEQAVVELGEERITVRVNQRWLNLERHEAQIQWARENGAAGSLQFTVHGGLESPAGDEEEMDMQAEAWARDLMRDQKPETPR